MVRRSLTLVFLNTAMLAVMIGSPRSVFRPTPRKGEPKNCAAARLLIIQRAWLKAIGFPVFRLMRPQSPPVAFMHWPTESKGALALLRMGRHVSSEPLVKSVGSHNP